MLLAIDIGNTTIAMALMKGMRVLAVERIETTSDGGVLKPILRRSLKRLLKTNNMLNQVVICSVVPKSCVIVEKIICEITEIKPKVVGRDFKVPVVNNYKKPLQVGQDRLVGVFAALKLYGKPLIVVDLGTAITFDAVSKKGEYLGGAIVAGLRLSAEALFAKTALLPKIVLKSPRSIIGQTTEESMLSGIFFGYGSLCRGMIELMTKRIQSNGDVHVVLTGGHTHIMKRFIASKIRIIDDHLVFKGLALLIKD